MKRVLNAYLFPNGNLACFDLAGEQISELQGAYSIDKHKRILLEATDNCKFEGFDILPLQFTKSAKDWADYFNGQMMSWEDIENL